MTLSAFHKCSTYAKLAEAKTQVAD